MKFLLLLVIGVIFFTPNLIYGRVLPKNIQKRDDLESGSSTEVSLIDSIRRIANEQSNRNHQLVVVGEEIIPHDKPRVVNQFFDPNENWFFEELEEQHNQQENHEENIDELLNSQHQQNHNINKNNENSDHQNQNFEFWVQYLQNLHELNQSQQHINQN
ncbi:hypothetical protein RN001_011360 [Aquatica leii]|uniref:Uncharacterized protein n=1 Tax=Aquatica leii TaxID=1421715 RepID=A0AAN7PVW9_9COLE|nr:hypothetical protein RN001_011360 [Aquatica leii]